MAKSQMRPQPALGRSEGTEEGRAAVARNALTHDITFAEPVLPGMESRSEWRRHLDGIIAGLGPEGDLEEALAERVANLLWRIRRLPSPLL